MGMGDIYLVVKKPDNSSATLSLWWPMRVISGRTMGLVALKLPITLVSSYNDGLDNLFWRRTVIEYLRANPELLGVSSPPEDPITNKVLSAGLQFPPKVDPSWLGASWYNLGPGDPFLACIKVRRRQHSEDFKFISQLEDNLFLSSDLEFEVTLSAVFGIIKGQKSVFWG